MQGAEVEGIYRKFIQKAAKVHHLVWRDGAFGVSYIYVWIFVLGQ